MKKVKVILLVLVLVVVSISCSSDDGGSSNDETSVTQENLNGVWKLSSRTFNGEQDQLGSCDLLNELIFNGSAYSEKYYYGPECIAMDVSSYAFTIEGNLLVVNDGGESFNLEVATLTNTTLSISDIDEGGVARVSTYLKQ